MNQSQKEVLLEAIEAFGANQQQLKAIEEAGEFIQATAKYMSFPSEKNKSNLIEEIADLEIMLYQIKFIHSIGKEVSQVASSKILRLNGRLQELKLK